MDQAVDTAVAARQGGRKALRIGIVGAGFGGIGLAILLKQAGFSAITLLEKGPAVGGTWRENTYPGAACDVPSHLYSFSFAPNPEWSQRYSGQAEILAYIQRTADAHGITPLVRFGSNVTRAVYDAASRVWQVTTAAGDEFTFDIFVPAVGQLSRPSIPDFPGRADFAGASFHSAQWRHDIDLRGKRVAVVGCAASAVQFIPEVAKLAGHVDVFQRTPNWLVPRNNGAYSARQKRIFARLPAARQAVRQSIYFGAEWLFGAFRTGTWRNTLLRKTALKHLAAQVADPALRGKLTPAYEIGCKRVLFSDDYYPVFAQPHVRLVTHGIDRIESAGIRTRDGTLHEADVVIYATGFDVANCLRPVTILGRDGRDLQTVWRDGPEAYRGVAVAGFPNMFIMYGPNTNLGHNSIIVMLEAQARYIVQCLAQLADRRLASIEVSDAASRAYNVTVQRRLAATVWSTGCGNWYVGPGGKITANWYGSTLEYGRAMRRVRFEDFLLQEGETSFLVNTEVG